MLKNVYGERLHFRLKSVNFLLFDKIDSTLTFHWPSPSRESCGPCEKLHDESCSRLVLKALGKKITNKYLLKIQFNNINFF